MSVAVVDAAGLVSGASAHDTVIDVRSPAEYAVDHLPGAVNWPVLDDEERRVVGTLYKQVSTLEARKFGAAIVARNIARHLERELPRRTREWRPLVYCWRGGQRSGAMAWFLGQIGFRTTQLGGGYKAWRALVREQLRTLPDRLGFHVLCGPTGSGKTRLLQALAAAGAQVLDLERLARHLGSVLGGLPGEPQPSQKRFESLVWQALSGFDAARPVFVESESRKIGVLRVPEALLQALRERGRRVRLELPDAARLDLLLDDYRHLTADAAPICRLLDGLAELRGRETVRRWQALAAGGAWRELFAMLHDHYDPLYERSLRASFAQLADAPTLRLPDAGPATLAEGAARLAAGRMA